MSPWAKKTRTKIDAAARPVPTAQERRWESDMRRSEITSADGLKLAAYEAGNGAGPEILFIHGFSQCAECWEPQFYDPQLSNRFRLTAFDIRGHGASDKPSSPERYAEDRFFADDVNAVMDARSEERRVGKECRSR